MLHYYKLSVDQYYSIHAQIRKQKLTIKNSEISFTSNPLFSCSASFEPVVVVVVFFSLSAKEVATVTPFKRNLICKQSMPFIINLNSGKL